MHLNYIFLEFLNINTPSKRSVRFCEELVTPVRLPHCPALCWLGAMTQVPQRPRGDHEKTSVGLLAWVK